MMMVLKANMSAQSQFLKGLESNPAELDINIYEFLIDSHYFIIRDSGYFGLDQLIDDNPEIFQASFERTIRKSLGLIYYSEDLSKLSTRKQRLRAQLFRVFESTQQMISRLASDHLLFLRVYTASFKYRVKLFSKETTQITSQLFGDKNAANHVKILFDSYMFYILKKRNGSIVRKLPVRRTGRPRRSCSVPAPLRYHVTPLSDF
jgi:hypothetical protein